MTDNETFMKAACLECKKILGHYQPHGNGARKRTSKFKDPKDIVTNVDLELESAIFSRLRESYPDCGIISEENERNALTGEPTWIIDPLDGTNNFAYDLPLYGVSLAYAEKKKVVAGAVYLYGDDAFYYAEKGKGATLNGKEIAVSSRNDTSHAFVLADARISEILEENKFGMILSLADAIFGVRMLGAAVYNFAYVAGGRVDGCLELDLKIVDFPAGALIVEEAGGKVTDTKGKPWSLETKDFLATNGLLHDKLLEIINAKNK